MSEKSRIDSIIGSLLGAIKTLGANPPITSDNLEREIEDVSIGNEADEIAKIHLRSWIKNKATLTKVMSRQEMSALLKANKTATKADENRVFEAELRSRGLPVFGETKDTTPPPVVPVAPVVSVTLPSPVSQVDTSKLTLDKQIALRREGVNATEIRAEISALELNIAGRKDGMTKDCLTAKLTELKNKLK